MTNINTAIQAPPEKAPKNIVLMIGDGMGLTHLTAAYYLNGDSLDLFRFPVTGLVKTHSSRERVTDSAAGATAMACGCKTRNGVLGLDHQYKRCASIVEQLEAEGWATGLIASSSLTHATPAAFVAHVRSRSQSEEIALAFMEVPVDLLIGGGMRPFMRRTSDKRDLLAKLTSKGYGVHSFLQGEIPVPDPARPFAYFSAVDEPESVIRGRNYLPTASRLALPYLKQRSEKGFFLMVEGSQIDWAGHSNNAANLVAEVWDFNAAIAEVLAFARADGETLVIVTADHETGGLAIEHGSTRDSMELVFTTKHHTGTLVPIFAYGPGATAFQGIMDNTDIYHKMQQLLSKN